jgi:hypothetical protein
VHTLNFLSPLRSRTTAVLAAAAVIAVAAGSGAVASSLVTSHDIKNGTIRSVDLADGAANHRVIQDGGVRADDLAPGLSSRFDHDSYVTQLGHQFHATNNTVKLTSDGVAFGPYPDGGAAGGSIRFNGLNGKKLSDIKSLVYYMRYTSTGDSGGVGVPYLRVFLNNDANDAIFSPNTQSPDADVAEGPFHEWVATSGSWRYDDDGGNGPDESFKQLLTAHGTDTISGIYISTGFSNGQNLASLLRWLQVNDTTYHFGR